MSDQTRGLFGEIEAAAQLPPPVVDWSTVLSLDWAAMEPGELKRHLNLGTIGAETEYTNRQFCKKLHIRRATLEKTLGPIRERCRLGGRQL